MSVRDEVTPGERWVFDEDVAASFSDMLERSIPQYAVMRQAVTDLASGFVRTGSPRAGVIVDLGASRGDGLQPLVDRFGAHATYHAVEVSEPMVAALRDRFDVPAGGSGQFRTGRGVTVHEHDLRDGYPDVPMADVTLCVLTLQFTPIEHRQRILRDVHEGTRPGGALILVEKVIGATAPIDALLVDRYYALKGANGYSPEQIERKRMSLEGVLVPVTYDWNLDLLKQAGFRQVDGFWRFLNFCGWIAIRS